jgi:hypothetical protein
MAQQLQVKWIRNSQGTPIPHYRYDGIGNWKPYTSYPNHPPDDFRSKGVPTFILWIKKGAVIEQGVGD